MIGWTVTGRQVELNELQEHVVRAVLEWEEHGGALTLPFIGRQGGKTTIMATIAEYHRRGHSASPGEMLRDRLAHAGKSTQLAMLNDPVFAAEVQTAGNVLNAIGATGDQVDALAGQMIASVGESLVRQEVARAKTTLAAAGELLDKDPVIIEKPSDDLVRDLGGTP